MNGYEWVIDTWVLATASNPKDPQSLDALGFLIEVQKQHLLAIDQSGQIEHEYHPYIYRRELTHVWQWWNRMNKTAGKIVRYSGEVPQQHRQYLINSLNFDQSDLKFVAVAYRSSEKFLVSEDSDYNPDVKDYLQQYMGVTTFAVQGALSTARA